MLIIRYLLFLFLLLVYTCSFGQICSNLYEQTAVDFFLDSIMSKDYLKVKVAYLERSIDTSLSLLWRPIGFDDYGLELDSTQTLELRKRIAAARMLDLSGCILDFNKGYTFRIRDIPRKWKKMNLKRNVAIHLSKGVSLHKGFIIVELTASHNYRMRHYFFEIDEARNVVVRWYSVDIYV